MKEMYALTWCYEGADSNTPSAQTIAVSESKNKLIEELKKWIRMDTAEIKPENYDNNEDFENESWNDDQNFEVVREDDTDVLLRHRKRTDLYTRYRIQSVQVL